MSEKKKSPKQSAHYVNNDELLAAIVEHRKGVIAARKQKQPMPRVPEFIGECFLRMAQHISFKSNFSNYQFREDMVSDGIENCLQYINNFDPEKSSNPFSYFTQIIVYAFIRRIKKEKKQLYIKYVSIQHTREVSDITGSTSSGQNDFERFMQDFIDQFEEPKKKKKADEPEETGRPNKLKQFLQDD